MIVIRGENRQAAIDAYYWFWHYSIAGLAPDNDLLNWCASNVVQFQTNEAKYVHGASRARLNYLIDNEAERFKGVKGGAMAEARQYHAVAVLDGKLYAVGGQGAGYNALSSVEQYDPALDAWEAVVPMATARAFPLALV